VLSNKMMTRRDALRQMAGSCATAALLPAVTHAQQLFGGAAEPPATVPGAVIAREANGAEIHQVTIEPRPVADLRRPHSRGNRQ